MAELRTEDCQKFLTTDPAIAQLVRDRLGLTDDPQLSDYDQEWRTYAYKAMKDAGKPKKWKRVGKVKLGSKTDLENMNFAEIWPQYADGGIARTFWLQDTDHITVVLVEYEGKIVAMDDVSD